MLRLLRSPLRRPALPVLLATLVAASAGCSGLTRIAAPGPDCDSTDPRAREAIGDATADGLPYCVPTVR